MHDDDPEPQPISRSALCVFGILDRGGGCMRPGPLLREANLPPDDLAAALNDLAGRSWVKVAWRKPGAYLRTHLPDRFREVEHIATTPFGRHRYPSSIWAMRAAALPVQTGGGIARKTSLKIPYCN